MQISQFAVDPGVVVTPVVEAIAATAFSSHLLTDPSKFCCKDGEIVKKVPEDQLLDTLREELMNWESKEQQ